MLYWPELHLQPCAMCVAAGTVLPVVPNAWLPRCFGAPSHTALLNIGILTSPFTAAREPSETPLSESPVPSTPLHTGAGRRAGTARPSGKVGGALPSGRCVPCAPPGRPGVAAGPPMAYDWVGLGYAALVASGGIIGYARAGGGGPGELYLYIWLFVYACVRGAGPLTAFSFPHPRQRPVSGRRAPLRWFGGVGGLPAGPRPKEYLAFSR